MRSEVIVYGSVQMSISKSIQCRYIANVILRVHASWQCQWGKKNLWLRFHLKQLDTYHNTTECFVCQKSWLKLTQMPSTCNCKYSQENIQRFESFLAHIPKTKHTFAYIMWLNFEWNHLCLCQNEVECLHLIYLALISETKATWKQNVVSCFPIQSFSRYDTRRTNIGNGKMTYTHMHRERRKREKTIWCAQQRPRPNQVKNYFY